MCHSIPAGFQKYNLVLDSLRVKVGLKDATASKSILMQKTGKENEINKKVRRYVPIVKTLAVLQP